MARVLPSRDRETDREATQQSPGEAPPRRRRTVGLVALATTLVLLAGGSLAVASAHKTVTIDVDGHLTEVSTFAGSVDGLLDAHGIAVGTRDLVAPEGGSALRDGDEVVVRHARQVTVVADGEEARIWTTALTADEVLAGLAGRGDEVRLVASRSAAQGRAELSVLLAGDGPVDVVADGETVHVPDGSVGLERVLADLDITIGVLDRVSVQRDQASGRVSVVVERVVSEELTTVSEVGFESRTERTSELFTDQRQVAVAGVPGERTTVHRLILVDGEEESRVLLSDGVTIEPVTEVIREGTAQRPAPRPTPAPAPTAGSGGGEAAASGGDTAASGAAAVSGDVWGALAQCESGGNPSIVSSNGLYHGLYQFSVPTWQSVGGSGLPSQASADEQTQRAQALQERSGWGQWPACSRKLGLR